MTYNLLTGGHAPGYLRDEFLEALEADVFGRATTPENDAKLHKLSGRLWNCTDQMPSGDRIMVVALVENRTGVDPDDLCIYSYAQAARAVRKAIDVGAT